MTSLACTAVWLLARFWQWNKPARAYVLAGKVIVPNLRYRNDIGQRLENRELNLLRKWGYIDT